MTTGSSNYKNTQTWDLLDKRIIHNRWVKLRVCTQESLVLDLSFEASFSISVSKRGCNICKYCKDWGQFGLVRQFKKALHILRHVSTLEFARTQK